MPISPPQTPQSMKAAEQLLLLGFGALAVLVLVAFLLTERNFQRRSEAFGDLAHFDAELSTIDRVTNEIVALHTDLRAFAIFGEEQYLREHLAANTQAESELTHLRELLGRAAAAPAVAAVTAYVAEQQAFRQRIQEIVGRAGADAARRFAGTLHTESRLAGCQKQLAALETLAWRNAAEARQAAAASDGEIRTALILIFTGIIILLCGSYLLLRRHLGARRRAEEGLRVLSTSLEQQVEQRAGQVHKANAELQREIAAHKRDAAQLQTLFESVPSGTVMLEQAGRIVLANRQVETLFGYSRDELIGQSIETLVHPAARAGSPPLKAAFWLEPGSVTGAAGHALRGRRKNKALFPIELRVIPVNTESGTFLLASMIDVSDRERAHAAQAHLASIVDSTTLGIVSTTEAGLVTSWNQGAERILGYSAEEMMGRPVSHAIPTQRQLEMQAFSERIRRGERLDAFESVCMRKDGRLVPVEITMAPIRDYAGGIVGSSAIVQDISRRKQLENDVLHVSDAEQQRLGRELHDDLGQQLAAIEFICQSLKTKMADHPAWAAQVEAVMGMLRRSIATIRSMAHGLAPYVIQSTGLCSALDQLRQTVAASGRINCRLACSERIALPNNDASTHLYRIAQEAVSNALRHSGATEITIALTRSSEAFRLEIADNGDGFPPLFREPGLGRRTMAYRAQLIGADFKCISATHAGVRIICTLPIHPDEN